MPDRFYDGPLHWTRIPSVKEGLYEQVKTLHGYVRPPSFFRALVYKRCFKFPIHSLQEEHVEFVRDNIARPFYFRTTEMHFVEECPADSDPDCFFFTNLSDYTHMKLMFSDAHL